MKILITLTLSLFVLFGCNQNNSSSENSTDAQEYFNSPKVDSVAIEGQVREFLFALMGGNPDVAVEYIYPEVFDWLQKTAPNERNIKAQMISMMKEQVVKTQSELDKRGEQVDLRINRIRYAGKDGNEKFYMVNCTLLVEPIGAKKGDPIKGVPENIIAISSDNGRNWKFMQYDEDVTAPVLRMNHPDKLVYDLLQLKDDQEEMKNN